MIALMIMINSLFAESVGYLLSILVLHIVGLAIVSIIMLYRREEKQSGAPKYLYLAGTIGVILVFSNNFCFQILGASLTLALGVTGQAMGSMITDSFGLLGMKKYPFRWHKLAGLIVTVSGLVLMVEKWELHLVAVFVALLTGMLVLLSMIINAQLSTRIGVFRGTRINYIAGLLTITAIILLTGNGFERPFELLVSTHPVLIFGGGFLGVATVASFNIVVPRIPTVYTTLMVIVGQLVCGVLIDYFLGNPMFLRKICGIVLVVAGAGLNLLVEQSRSESSIEQPEFNDLTAMKADSTIYKN